MHVGIVGSRNWPDLESVRLFVLDELPDDTTVISGGARGVDRTAERAADERGFHWCSFRPRQDAEGRYRIFTAGDGLGEWESSHGRTYPSFGGAALARNRLIVQHSQRIVAFNCGSVGTSHTVRIARELGIPVDEIRP